MNGEDTTITLDLAKEMAALNAAYIYLRARGINTWDYQQTTEVAEKVRELHANPQETDTHTVDYTQFMHLFASPFTRARYGNDVRKVPVEELDKSGHAQLEDGTKVSFEVVGVLLKRAPCERQEAAS